MAYIHTYTPGGFVWGDRPFYLVKWLQEKWACGFHDDVVPLSEVVRAPGAHLV